MSYLSHGPEIYQYNPQSRPVPPIQQRVLYNPENNSVTYVPNQKVQSNVVYPPPPAFNRFGQSQIERVYEPLVAPNQQPPQYNPSQIYMNSTRPDSQIQVQAPVTYKSQIPTNAAQNTVEAHNNQEINSLGSNRFDNYLTADKAYKYNLFSMIDQPWNNCLKGQKCGSLPGNECIATDAPVRQWQ